MPPRVACLLLLIGTACVTRRTTTCTEQVTPSGIVSACRDLRGLRDGPYERRLDGRLVERARYAGGQLHGEYESWWADGARQARGRYDHGRRDGAWSEWHENGKPWRELAYAQGVPSGRIVEREYNGNVVFDGAYERGRVHGAWQAWRIDGTLRGRGESRAGKLHGQVIMYSPDGSRVEYDYQDNRVHGLVVEYDPTGAVRKTSRYRDGVEVKDDAATP